MTAFNVEFLYHKSAALIIEKTMGNLGPGHRLNFKTKK